MKLGQLEKLNSIIITFVFLMLLWCLFTFSLDPFSLLLGGAFSLIIALAASDLFIEKEEKVQRGILPRFELFIFYLLVLLWEIYLGSLNVVYRVITMKIDPGIIKIKTKLGSKLGRALLANSITLTPGTVTVELKDNELYVHWLVMGTTDPRKAAKTIKGNFETQLGRIFY